MPDRARGPAFGFTPAGCNTGASLPGLTWPSMRSFFTRYIKATFVRGALLQPDERMWTADCRLDARHTMKKASAARKTVAKKKTAAVKAAGSSAKLVDARLKALGDWRGRMLARLRALIRQADPEVVEEVKWRKPSNPAGVPVWKHAGIICTGETYRDKVKLTFARGAALPDPSGLFNSGLDGNVRRAIDIREGETIDEVAFKALVRAAVKLNEGKKVT